MALAKVEDKRMNYCSLGTEGGVGCLAARRRCIRSRILIIHSLIIWLRSVVAWMVR